MICKRLNISYFSYVFGARLGLYDFFQPVSEEFGELGHVES